MTRHTPGPWKVGRRGKTTTRVDAPGGDIRLGYGSWEGVVTCWGSEDNPAAGRPVMAANARLVAAAPELLEALETLLAAATSADVQCKCVNESVCKPAVQQARAAIKRARGLA